MYHIVENDFYNSPLRGCGGLEMAPHENKWSPLDGAHE